MDTYEELQNKYLKLVQEHENAKQELHECKRNLNIMGSTQQDYKHEVDMLQSEEIKQKQKYQEIIKQLEQNINDMRAKHCEEIQTFEDHILRMNEKNEKLRSEFSVFKDTTQFQSDTSSLIDEILYPPEYYENEELKLKLQESVDACKLLEDKLQELTKEMDNLKESYEYKKTELIEANENNIFLVDENTVLRKELDILKSQPLNEESKGNSLFAEVNDRRVYLQDQINKMKSTYVAMAQEKTHLENIVHHLKLENLRLLEKWKADISEIDDDKDEIHCSLRSRMKILEKLNQQYARELAEKPWIVSKIGVQEIEFFEVMLNDKKTEIKSLRDEVLNKALAQMSFAKELTEARSEKRKWRLDAMAKHHELEILKRAEHNSVSIKENIHTSTLKERLSDAIEEQFGHSDDQEEETLNENADNYLKQNTDFQNPKVVDSSFKAKERGLVTKEIESIHDKENVSPLDQSRKVTFANDTVSPKRTSRRKCMVLSRPPVDI